MINQYISPIHNPPKRSSQRIFLPNLIDNRRPIPIERRTNQQPIVCSFIEFTSIYDEHHSTDLHPYKSHPMGYMM